MKQWGMDQSQMPPLNSTSDNNTVSNSALNNGSKNSEFINDDSVSNKSVNNNLINDEFAEVSHQRGLVAGNINKNAKQGHSPNKSITETQKNTQSQPRNAPSIEMYLDYRQFLNDFFEFKKSCYQHSRQPYTYAHFAVACGLKAPQYLKMIIERERNLSIKTVTSIAKGIGLKKEEAEEFRLLVLSNQESDTGKRALLFKELMDFRVKQKIRQGQLNASHFKKIPNWAAWVLFESAYTKLNKKDAKALRSFLRNKVSTNDIEQALEPLIKDGLLAYEPDVGFKKLRNLIENAEEIPTELVRSLQSQFMYLALESLHQDPPTEREFGSATLALTQKEFEAIRFKLRQLRKAVQKETQVARAQAKADRIYQLNIQLYPVTAPCED